MVPVVDLSRRGRDHLDAFQAAVERVVLSGQVLLGPELEALESELTAWAGTRHAVALGSGAGALQLGLAALGVGPGDEVIVPAFTAVPTASAVCAVGAVPVPVDVEPATGALDDGAARAAITDRTRAAVPVHLYGRPTVVPDLGVAVLEDAAQAHGALHGITGRAAVYSFYPTKNMGGIGDGGVLVTDDDDIAATVRRRRVHGMAEQYVHTEISQNFRLSELEAAWLRLLLPEVAAGNQRRAEIARAYRAAAPDLCWPADDPRHVYHLCVARVPDRRRFRARLADAGVATAVHYPLALTQQPAYQAFTRCPCPEAEAWAATCVTLPCFPELTDDEVATVCDALEQL
ncbi:MAG TPA: DegT/DnrJ/EryC1/StrS family aminotransferase [Acidimicrobiales bacterium]